MTFLLAISGGYLLVLGLMYFFQDHLLFIPSSDVWQTPASAGLQAEDFWIETEDGITLHGWFFPNRDAEPEFIVVFSHGNAGNISHRLELVQTILKSGAAVVLYDYRGYGKSEGKPDEEGLYSDITAVVRYLKEKKGYSEDQIILYGRSLGGAVAAYGAVTFRPAGLVLDSAFKNLGALVKDVYPFVPPALARYEFPTEKFIRGLNGVPLMILHSRRDELVKFHHAEFLYSLADDPKTFVELRGGHNSSFAASRDLYLAAWKDFLQSLSGEENAD